MPDLEYIRQKLKELDSAYDARPGTVIDDMLVLPNMYIMAPLANAIETVRLSQSVLNYESIDETLYDYLMSNLLVERIEGQRSVASVRVYFESPISLTVSAGDGFLTGSGLKFIAIGTQSITAETMANRVDEDGFYYIDVPVIANEAGAEYEVAADSITRVESPSVSYVKATNIYPASPGRDRETNFEVYTRAQNAVTARDIVTDRGSKFLITQNFTNISQVTAIGFNDPEMYRDVLIGHHFGGYTDIYVKTLSTGTAGEVIVENMQPDAEFGEIIIYVGADGDITDVPLIEVREIQIGYVAAGVFEVDEVLTKSEDVDVYVPDTSTWVYRGYPVTAITGDRTVDAKHVRYSEREQWQIRIHSGHIGKAARIVYDWLPEIQNVQDYVETTERVVAEDVLIKSFVPAYIDMDIELESSPELEEDPDYVEAIEDFINSQDVGQTLEVSDIINELYENGAQKVTLPLVVTARIQHLDGTVTEEESENVIEIEDDVDKPITKRIVRFFPGEITVTVV